ncbi:MAG TPA: diacylglycerol kinase family protein [Anaerolineales bacterium]|nr:diacylglycerol kinase family protein [Anaerolineales bacterium]
MSDPLRDAKRDATRDPRRTSRLRSFGHAFAGMAHVLRTQRNAWIHAVATVTVVALGLWLRVTSSQWPPLLLAIGLVWMAEFVNTALEAVVDMASPGRNPLARVGKDVGAAAVLVAALAAAIVGLVILLPPLAARLGLGS